MKYALLDDNNNILRISDLTDDPPQLAPQKSLRWLPVIDPPAEDGLQNATWRVTADAVVREWVPATEHVPVQVTMFQARAALIRAGLFAAIDALIRGLPADSLSFQAWEYGTHVPRSGTLVEALAREAGLTDAQLDDLFREAALITG